MKSTRNTQQKKIIMQALTCADHPTASELYDCIHEKYPAISKATVFRVLSQYADGGEITKFTLLDSSMRFDFNTKPHPHFRCNVCGKIYDVWDERFSAVLGLSELDGFDVTSCNIELSGVCRDCKEKKQLMATK